MIFYWACATPIRVVTEIRFWSLGMFWDFRAKRQATKSPFLVCKPRLMLYWACVTPVQSSSDFQRCSHEVSFLAPARKLCVCEHGTPFVSPPFCLDALCSLRTCLTRSYFVKSTVFRVDSYFHTFIKRISRSCTNVGGAGVWIFKRGGAQHSLSSSSRVQRWRCGRALLTPPA